LLSPVAARFPAGTIPGCLTQVYSLAAVPAVGDYLTAIFTNVAATLNAGAIAVILMIVKDRVTE
jgi:hypothetical protein